MVAPGHMGAYPPYRQVNSQIIGPAIGMFQPTMALVLAVCLAAVACGGGLQPSAAIDSGGKLRVITTTPILADLVRNVGGELVEVSSLVPLGADVHSFQTSPKDSIALSQAELIVANGLGLDDFLKPVIASAKREGVAELIVAVELAQADPPFVVNGGTENGETENVGAGNGGDPHFWLNPQFAIAYVERIRDALTEIEPRHAQSFQDNAALYISKLVALDLEIAETLDQVPAERRRLVTLHDAFGHFAGRYGWETHAFIASDADEVSPGSVAQILQLVRDSSLPAIFLEPQLRSNVVQRASEDAGVAVGTIHSILSEPGANSYVEMMRSNARSMAELLR